jgi:GMP synthase (glutamine-hydrolysing)
VCLGAQTLAHALGAAVGPLDRQLVGFQETRLTDDGRADLVLGTLPPVFEAFNGNHYACGLPDGATALATGPCLQAFRAGDRAWAVQFHPEVKGDSVLSWFDGESRTEVARQLEGTLPGWLPLGTELFRAFLREAA